MLARMQGIAEGAGLPLRSVCLMNAMEAFIGSVEGRTVVPPLGACSALAVRGTRSRTGEPIIARNFDYPPLFQPFFMLRESRPRDGFRSLDFAVAPQAGTVDGVNEKGLAITLNYAFVTDSAPPNPLITMLIADALASCATVTEAVRRITASPRMGSGNADARGCFRGPGFGGTLQHPCRCPPPRRGRRIGCSSPMFAFARKPVRFKCRNRPPTRTKRLCRCAADRSCSRTRIAPGGSRNSFRTRAASARMNLRRSWQTMAPPACRMERHRACTPITSRPPPALQWFPARRRVRVSYSTACTAQYVEIAL